MKEEVRKSIVHYLNTLKEKCNQQVYNVIKIGLLKIHTEGINYEDAIEQIEEKIPNIAEPENGRVWDAAYMLSQSVNGAAPVIQTAYKDEILQNQEACIKQVTGEIYDLILNS